MKIRLRLSRQAAADWAVILMALLAVGLTGYSVWDRSTGPEPRSREDHRLSDGDWERLMSVGNRVGPSASRVTVVYFIDYQCPFCRNFEPTVEAALSAYPSDVAFVFRHLPLTTIHANAYRAAKLAQCAADRGRYWRAHQLLIAEPDLAALDAGEVARRVEIPDIDDYSACAGADTVAAVERDIRTAHDIDVTGTPTVVINGLRLGEAPDSSRLFELIGSELKGADSR